MVDIHEALEPFRVGLLTNIQFIWGHTACADFYINESVSVEEGFKIILCYNSLWYELLMNVYTFMHLNWDSQVEIHDIPRHASCPWIQDGAADVHIHGCEAVVGVWILLLYS